MFLNRVDQLGNADGFRKKWMPLDIETTLCLRSGYQCRKKYDRHILQFRVGLDSCCYFASVRLWHHDIEQDYIWPKIQGALMSLGSVVFFEHQIVAGPFEKDFHQMSGVRVVIDNQDAPCFFHCRTADRTWPGETGVGFPRKKICFDYLFHSCCRRFLAFLTGQPGNEPGAEESKH